MKRVVARVRGAMSARGASEVGVALVAAVLVAGVLIGSGFAQTALHSSDGLAWVGDDERGEVVQVNPATGRPETRLSVAPPGHPIDVAQRDGLLVITDAATGLVSVIDVATLSASGYHQGSADLATKVLLGDASPGDASLYVVDRVRGTITQLDPATAATVGTPWAYGGPIADAAIDGEGVIWVLGSDARLANLTWSGTTLAESAPARTIQGAGPQSVLVAHPRGVTIFGAEGGLATRAGTGQDHTVPAPALGGPLLAAARAPTGLVPVSVPDRGHVVMLTADNAVRTVDVNPLRCAIPGVPLVYGDRVYVPCPGGRVVVLGPDGRHLDDIATPGDGTPNLVADDERLIIHSPGATTGVVVEPNGRARIIEIYDDATPVYDPADPIEPEPPAPPRPKPGGQSGQGGSNQAGSDHGGGERGGGDPGGGQSGAGVPTPPSDGDPSDDPLGPPANVVAEANTTGQVTVTWSPTGTPTAFRVLRADTGAEVANVAGTINLATVTTVPAGTRTAFQVVAVRGGEAVPSALSNAVTVQRVPDPPTGVRVDYDSDSGTAITVTVRWTPGVAMGSPVTAHRVTVRTASAAPLTRDVGATTTSAQFTIGCGTACWDVRVDASVIARSAIGDSSIATGSYTHGPEPRPRNGDAVISSITDAPSCPVGPQCRVIYRIYTARLSPPDTWGTFDGTCSLVVAGSGSMAATRPISCSATSAVVGSGDGGTYSVSVQACDGTCVRSATRTVVTAEPIETGPWCGDFLC